MSKYIQHIIKYFFSHQLSEETTSEVKDRILRAKEEEIAPAMHEVWDGLDHKTLNRETVEEAYENTRERLFGPTRRHRTWWRMAAIWVVPLLLLGTAYYFYQNIDRGPKYADVCFMHKFTAYGECELVTLPDSSKVWLNGGSTLIYPSYFAAKERNVCLVGEAFFDIKKNPEQPFIVDVNQLRLKVLGTTFNVYAYPNDPKIMATLETGSVQVDVENKDKPYLLNPNDQLTYNAHTGEVSIEQVNARNYSSWRSGALFFNNIPFDKALEQLERAYNVNIYVLNNKYNTQTLRAHFNSGDSIQDVMEIFKMLIPNLKYEIRGDDIYIK